MTPRLVNHMPPSWLTNLVVMIDQSGSHDWQITKWLTNQGTWIHQSLSARRRSTLEKPAKAFYRASRSGSLRKRHRSELFLLENLSRHVQPGVEINFINDSLVSKANRWTGCEQDMLLTMSKKWVVKKVKRKWKWGQREPWKIGALHCFFFVRELKGVWSYYWLAGGGAIG